MALTGSPVRINAFCPGGIATQLVPAELGADPANMMTLEAAAAEVIDLLLRGGTGDIRLKLRPEAPSQIVPPPSFTLGS